MEKEGNECLCAKSRDLQQENHVMYAQQIDIESSKQLFLLANTLTQVSLYTPFLPFDPCILCLAELFFHGKSFAALIFSLLRCCKIGAWRRQNAARSAEMWSQRKVSSSSSDYFLLSLPFPYVIRIFLSLFSPRPSIL